MKIIKLLAFIATFAWTAASCGGGEKSQSAAPDAPSQDGDKPSAPAPSQTAFAKGADISWVTQMEEQGHKFYNAEGKETDCFQLMKELGLDAVRLRVWVDPMKAVKYPTKWCDTQDMVNKAKRAAALGMDVMVDFHYSDGWADPGQQHKPADWKGLSLPDLKKKIHDYTAEVMTELKKAGVTPKWVQVGNEIRPGMIWDEKKELSGASYDIRACDVKEMGWTSTEVKFPMNWANLGAFIAEGYNGVKSVFPESIVIVHLDNGYDQELYKWFFDELKKNGGKWDMIGMSIYPYWTMKEHPEYTSEKTITDCIANVNFVSRRYDCDVMIVETGMQCGDGKGGIASDAVLNEGKELLTRLINESRDNTNGRCKGVFYWEPQCKPGQYQLGAFTADGKPTVIMEAFK